MSRNIRPMVAQDKPAIMQILSRTTEFDTLDVKIAEEVIDSFFDFPDSGYFILVLEEENEIVGYICYGPTPLTRTTWDIYWMAVTPEKKGKGIGGTLLQLVEKEIKNNKGRLIVIETSSKSNYDLTRLFYKKQNYAQACQIKDYYDLNDDLVIFTKHF